MLQEQPMPIHSDNPLIKISKRIEILEAQQKHLARRLEKIEGQGEISYPDTNEVQDIPSFKDRCKKATYYQSSEYPLDEYSLFEMRH